MITIQTSALKYNLQRVRTLAPRSKILAMIKSDGYGHGIITVANALSAAEGFGVAHLSEALLLRKAGFPQKIVWMEGFNNEEDLQACITHHIDPVVHHIHQISILENSLLTSSSSPLNIWMKIDTGMHRLGFSPEDFSSAYQRLIKCKSVSSNITLMSHFANVFTESTEKTNQQIQLFNKLTAHYTHEKSLANSGGILRYPESHYDWVRPGIMLYGVTPFDHHTGTDHDLQPVMTFHSHLQTKKVLSKGSPVGYSGKFICPEDMIVGVIPVGYGDGYPRHIDHNTAAIIHHKKCNLIGTVSMNLMSVDLRECPDAKIGDPILLWGQFNNDILPVEVIAEHANTIPYELLTQVKISTL